MIIGIVSFDDSLQQEWTCSRSGFLDGLFAHYLHEYGTKTSADADRALLAAAKGCGSDKGRERTMTISLSYHTNLRLFDRIRSLRSSCDIPTATELPMTTVSLAGAERLIVAKHSENTKCQCFHAGISLWGTTMRSWVALASSDACDLQCTKFPCKC